MFGLSPVELMVIGTIAVLLFGSNLPSVAKSLGRSISEFKEGMRPLERELRGANDTIRHTVNQTFHEIDDRNEAKAPRFEVPPASQDA